MAHIATSEALVPIALAELLLLRRLIVPWGGSWVAVGCRLLLLLRWPDHPSACLLLKTPALIVRNNPEPLSLSGWCCHWCLSLLLCPVSNNAILLRDGHVDQLIHIATSETLVPIALAELLLLRRLIVPWGGSWKAVGCRLLLLLRWPDHPSACLLLKTPALIVRNNPEPLSLSGWCCHWCLPLLLCPVSNNAILLGDGNVDQLIEVISPDSVETVTELSAEPPPEPVSLLLIRIRVISSILAQVARTVLRRLRSLVLSPLLNLSLFFSSVSA